MNFPLDDLRGLTAMLGDALREPLAQGSERGLSDGDLVESLRVVEEIGRWVDAARLTIAGEIGRRSEPGVQDVPLVTAYGCDNPGELIERAAQVSHVTARTRLRTARAITPVLSLTGHIRPAPLDHARRELAAGRLSLDALTTITDALRPLQRRVGAEHLAAAAASPDSPRLGGAAPTLVVTVAEDQLDCADGVAFVDGPDGETPVSAAFARHIGCHGTIHRVTLGANGAIKALTVIDRVFTHWQRKGIGARDGGCIIPGCRVRAAWCEIHHVVEHSRGGPTDTGNGVLLCWHHHRTIETSGWEVRMRDGTPEVRPPAWIDPLRRWRPANRVLHNELQRSRSA
ncbi:HNH endonuclease signature motif containing protein [Microbacterium jejuense]|uniref:HNH endonuclease signature motif containing protein n=1 Tax=Microbacterium jejuense TaxID=1263637 RepID=UPI0031E80A0B